MGTRDGIFSDDIREIETQRRAQARDIAPILPSPQPENIAVGDTDKIIFAAMRSELDRNRAALILPGGPKPYYISYTIARYRHFQMIGSLGGLLHSSVPVEDEWRDAGNAW